jgi:hypothetical protein
MLTLCPKFTLQVMLPIQPSQTDQNFVMIFPSKLKIQLKFSTIFLCRTFFTFPRFRPTLFPALTALPEGRAGSVWELSEQ